MNSCSEGCTYKSTLPRQSSASRTCFSPLYVKSLLGGNKDSGLFFSLLEWTPSPLVRAPSHSFLHTSLLILSQDGKSVPGTVRQSKLSEETFPRQLSLLFHSLFSK